jgi:hypothetical protein
MSGERVQLSADAEADAARVRDALRRP